MNDKEQIDFYKGLANEQRQAFFHLTRILLFKLLTKKVQGQTLPLKGADWNTTEDGRVFPFLIFERTDLTLLERRKQPRWSGYVCPNCASEMVVKVDEKVSSHSREHTVWLQSWKCEGCHDTWQYKKVWAD